MLWRNRAVERHSAAKESRKAIDLALAVQNTALDLNQEAADTMRRCLRQMNEHLNCVPLLPADCDNPSRPAMTHLDPMPTVLWSKDLASRSEQSSLERTC